LARPSQSDEFIIWRPDRGHPPGADPDPRVAAAGLFVERATPELFNDDACHRDRSPFPRRILENFGWQYSRIEGQRFARRSRHSSRVDVRACRLVTGRAGCSRFSSAVRNRFRGWCGLRRQPRLSWTCRNGHSQRICPNHFVRHIHIHEPPGGIFGGNGPVSFQKTSTAGPLWRN
jgi:hypothetical protein